MTVTEMCSDVVTTAGFRKRIRRRMVKLMLSAGLVATGPISIDVEYALRPAAEGSELCASVSVRGSGLIGRVLAQATDALLAAGALDLAVSRIRRQLNPALAA